MRLRASGSSAARRLIRGPQRSAEVLGAADAGLYLGAGRAVLAVVATDAVRLPCAVVLPSSVDSLPLRYLAPDGPVTVGGGRLGWCAHGARVEIDVVREWAPARVGRVTVRPDRLAELHAGLTGADAGIDVPATAPDASAAARLLGRGPGLTPSGDDLLAGFLLGCRAFGAPGRATAGVAAAVATRAATATTALSAALLAHALAGRCVPEVSAVVRGLGAAGPLHVPLQRLLQVGHTSGTALAYGLLRAAEAPPLARTAA